MAGRLLPRWGITIGIWYLYVYVSFGFMKSEEGHSNHLIRGLIYLPTNSKYMDDFKFRIELCPEVRSCICGVWLSLIGHTYYGIHNMEIPVLDPFI